MSFRPNPHLGDLAAALVDGELDHDGRDRVLAHLAHCGPCRAQVDVQRRAKALLQGLAAPGTPAELEAALLSIPRGSPGPAARPARPRSDSRRPVGRRGSARRRRVPSARRHHRVRYLVAGGASFVLVGLGVAVVAGGQPAGPAVTPPVGRFVVEHVATTGELPFHDPAVGAVTVSYATGTGP